MNYNESIDASVLAWLWGGCAPATTGSSLEFIQTSCDIDNYLYSLSLHTWDILLYYKKHWERMVLNTDALVESATK